MDHYYIQTNTDWIGPLSWKKLIEFVKRGVVRESTVISINGKTSKPAKELFGNDWFKIAPEESGSSTAKSGTSLPPANSIAGKKTSPPPPPTDSTSAPTQKPINVRAGSTSSSRHRSRYQSVVANRFQTASGLLDIFDWRFEKYVTPIIVRVTWVICVLLAALTTVLVLIALIFLLAPELSLEGNGDYPSGSTRPVEYRFPELPAWFTRRALAIAWAIGSIAGIILTLLWTRVLLETSIVVFNIASSLSSIDRKIDDSGGR